MTTRDGNLTFNLAEGNRLAVQVGDGQVSFLDNVMEATMEATVAALRLGMELGRDLAAAQHGSELQAAMGSLRTETAAFEADLRATAAANATTVAASVAAVMRDVQAGNTSLRTAIAEQRGYATSEVVQFGPSRRVVHITHADDDAHRRLVSVVRFSVLSSEPLPNELVLSSDDWVPSH